MNIHCLVIPESEQRPEVSGADWWFDINGDLQVRVSPMSDWHYETLLAIHEAFEACLCRHDGVTQRSVDDFDQEYYLTHSDDCDAGDDPKSPYRQQHCAATAAERIMAAHFDICWAAYDAELASRYPGPTAMKPHETH